MSLSHEHVGSKIPAKINTYMLTRAELLFTLCYEIPCTSKFGWTTFVPVSFQFLPVYFQSTSSLFQSTSNPLPVYFQFSSRLQPTSKSTFLCQIFDFLWNYYKLIRYTVWANNDIIDYPLCSVEKTKNDQKNWNKECELPQNLIEW